jgi:hypothetical protein
MQHEIVGMGSGLMYAHAIFERIIQRVFFKNPSAKGVRYFQLFKPIPLRLLALVAAVVSSTCSLSSCLASRLLLPQVQNVLDEWALGDPANEVDFTANLYQHVYENHLTTLAGEEELCRARPNNYLLDWRHLLADCAR